MSASRTLRVLVLLMFLSHCTTAVERHYYIAAVNINWDYTSDGHLRTGPSYKKAVFREYNAGFTQPKTHPSSSGLLGPTLRGQEGDTITVTFKNMADHPCSIHPHGIAYGKQSEGALYFDNTSLFEKEDDVILPGHEHTYQWEVTSEVTPTAADPPCLTYTYISHYDIVRDFNTGLIGAMLICKKGSLDDSGRQLDFHQESVLLFGVFDESRSWYGSREPPGAQQVKHTINGYTNGSVPGLSICTFSKVSWHLLAMSSEPELFSVHFNGQVLEHGGHKTSAIGIIAGTATSAIMSAIYPGRWLVSSHISRHLEAGLHGYVNIETCENFSAPKRRLTIQQKQESQEWTFYIAAEEFVWDYAPNMPGNTDGSFRSKYFKQGPQRIGKRYKKAVFTQYKDGTFKERAEEKQRKMELGILGPVIRAQIRDVIKIVFRNKASRPYSIYPHGLTIDKAAEGASYPDGGNQTHRVQPGDTYTYVWSVTEENVPTDSDPRCLTRMYHSAVDTPRDIASGLVGPLLICKSQSLNKKNVQLKADKEQQAMFAVFDENKSWYHDENIQTYCSEPHKVQKEDPEFYKSNVMHTINGYMYESGQDLGFCNGEIVTWHVSSVGQQDYIQTATFYGHTFELKNREEDVLSLFPMTGETITMNMLNIGIWLLASLNSHDSNKGMRVKFKDLECFRDYVMEYDYESPEFKVWIPQPVEETKKEIKPIAPKEVDKQSDYYADVLGFSRSARSIADEAELSFLDHDDGLFPTVVEEKRIEDEIKNASLNFNLTISETLDLVEAEPSREGVNKTTEESLVPTGVYFNVVKTSNASRNHSLDFVLDGTQTANRTGNSSEVEGNFTMAKQSPNQTSANTADSPETLQTRASDVADDDHNGSVEAFTYTVTGSGSPHTSSEAQAEEVFVLLDGGRLTDVSTDNETSEEHDLPPTQSEIISQELSGNTGEATGNETGSQELNSTRGNYTETNSEAESTSDANLTNGTHQRNELESSNKTSESSPEPPMNASKLPEHMQNIITPLGKNNNSSMSNSSEDKSEESRDEVVIYLMGNHSEAIITSHLDLTENWEYDGKHEVVSMKIPDQIYKYVTDGPEATPNATKSEKKKKIVHHRVKPSKGFGMKTKKRKDYKPQPRSALSSKGLSPRGFGPPAFGPRGARPVSSEEDIMGEAIVIGVPRRDFKNYDLYLPKHEKDSGFDGTVSEEYEYVEYKDPYGKKDSTAMDATAQHFLKLSEDQNTRTYFISAEEEEWDYAGYGQRRLDKTSLSERSTSFKKVLFRKYLDSTFTVRDIRGEMDEHLGILGPVIKAEVDQTVMIFFRNRASRPFSLHANGVHYLKQMEGLSYDDQSPYWYKQDDAVQPNSSYVYMWTANPKSGPKNGESDCRTWTYYSAVNPERDINSGLIGPLLVCRKGTLKKEAADRREFVLLFMSFDENKSWYYDENRERIERKNKRAVVDPNFQQNLKFEAINGIIYSLKGLRMYTNQLAKWHLINMGSTKDLHSVHFHGQTFVNKDLKDHRQGVYPLLPGGFATLEMLPSKPGLWQLESEVGLSQQRGMQTLFLVLDNMCDHPLGLTSGTVKDEQITASDHRGQWSPNLARLDNKGKHNAWSTRKPGQHIQVDFQRPVVISKVVTQGAKQFMKSHFAVNYTISYSTDKKKWIFYKGDSTAVRKTFEGNSEAHEKKENIFFPPLIGRYVRLHPLHSYNYPTIRMEYYGCELDGCSVPLGMQSGRIKDGQITASSVASSWYTGHWHPWYARLNKQGTTNAWQAKNHDMQQWIQVVLSDVKKITGIITQGAKSLGSEMFVTAYTLEYSDDGKFWTKYTDDEDYEEKTFQGNTDNNGQVKNYIYPPIFSRYLRIIPKRWQGAMTMRMELLGCDFE